MTEQINKLPRFTAAERLFIKSKLFDGLTSNELLKSFKSHFYPGNNYCGNREHLVTWRNRVSNFNVNLDKSQEFKDLLKKARTALANKDARIQHRKNLISKVTYLLAEYDSIRYLELDKDEQDGYIKLNNLLLKHLKDLAIELGEYKTTSINFDQRKQLQVIQQQNVFGGQATVPHLEGDNSTGLRIVAPSVTQLSEDPTAIRGVKGELKPERYPVMPKPVLDASKEVKQPPEPEQREE